MEPTILKTPSIHKGAGIYNTGAEGGGMIESSQYNIF